MNYEEKPLPTLRRRSLFDDEDKGEETGIFKGFPEEPIGIYYPEEYVEKVNSEIDQWKLHIAKVLEEKQKFKSERMELRNAILSEKMLSSEQWEFLDSIKLDEYMRKVKDFCDQATIFMNTVEYKPETETEYWYLAAQRKIEKEIIEKYVKRVG